MNYPSNKTGSTSRENNQGYNTPPFNGKFDPKWIELELNVESIKYTKDLAEYVQKDLTKSQIRNIFGEIRRIETLNADIRQVKFLLLLPKLAYSVAKSQKNLKPYRDEFEKWYNVVNEGVKDDTFGKRFDNFVNFFESFLAFHRVVAQKD